MAGHLAFFDTALLYLAASHSVFKEEKKRKEIITKLEEL